jgi:hypothetical protein
MVGAAVLLVGTFLPIVRVPVFGGVTSYVGDGRGDGIIVAALAVLAACAALVRFYRSLWAISLLAVAVMSFTFALLQFRLSEMREDQGRFANAVQLDWGWAVLAVGAIFMVAAAATGEAGKNRRRSTLILALAGVSLIVTSVGTGGATWVFQSGIVAYREAEQRAALRATEEARQESARRAAEAARQMESARLSAEREAARRAAEREAAKRADLQDKTIQEVIAVDDRGRKSEQPSANQRADAASFKVSQNGVSAMVSTLTFVETGLVVGVVVENGGARPISFRPWGRSSTGDVAELIDSTGRRCRPRTDGATAHPISLQPGGQYEDRITFPGVDESAGYLDLDLPAAAFSGYGKFRFRISKPMLVLKTARARGSATLSGLSDLLNDSEAQTRQNALAELARQGPTARTYLEAVAERLIDADPGVRKSAEAAIRAMEPFGRSDVTRLVALCKRRQVEIRGFAIRALAAIGADAVIAVPEFITALRDDIPELRIVSASALGKFGTVSSDVAPALIRATNDELSAVRLAAIRALISLPADAEIADALVKLLRNNDEAMAKVAADGVAQYSRIGKQHVPALIQALRNGPPSIRAGAIAALQRMGGDAKEAIPALMSALTDRDPAVRKQIVGVLPPLGAAALPAVPELGRLLGDSNSDVKRAAVDALDRLGGTSAGAAPALVAALRDPEISDKAEQALLRVGPPAAGALLTAIDKSNNVSNKVKLIATLGKMGRDAKGALADLDSMATSDSIPSVRRAAAQAAQTIRKKN